MALIARADLEARAGAQEIGRFAGAGAPGDAKIAARIAEGEHRMRSEATKWCTAESWDAMTSSTLPLTAKIYLVSDVVSLLAAGNEHREEIDTMANDARMFRIRLAKNEERCFDGVLVAKSSGRVMRHRRGGGDVFTRTSDGSGDFDRHDPSLP